MNFAVSVSNVMNYAFMKAAISMNEYVTPEHFLFGLCDDHIFVESLEACGGDVDHLKEELNNFFEKIMSKRNPEAMAEDSLEEAPQLELSGSMDFMFTFGVRQALMSGRKQVTLAHMLKGMMNLKESHALFYLSQEVEDMDAFFSVFQEADREDRVEEGDGSSDIEIRVVPEEFEVADEDADSDAEDALCFGCGHDGENKEQAGKKALKYATCLNDRVHQQNPLIGRKAELARTIQVLCCKDLNNPIHIGEAGVGKTALAYGLADLINQGEVPELLKDAKVYQLDMGALVAGSQYRGEFEKRMRTTLDALLKESFPIVYIDEIHTICGMGDSNGGTDAISLLKPYFESQKIRFMGSTTHEDYNKSFGKNRGLARRFQTIEVKEPSMEECVEILEGIRMIYEEHHHVVFDEGFMEQAVELSSRYLHERFLPDKAIRVLDETGAWLQLHPGEVVARTVDGTAIVTKEMAEHTISDMCRIPVEQVNAEESESLLTLKERMGTHVYGQEEALQNVSYAVQISRLGLGEEHKPVASLLFVGPTGVGKTETAKMLAKELGISFVRFDMSEYTERHTVAKLIGSPAGYVGYDDGGLLTDAVRKNPHCVLLLDEIEKAHSDIYNILLQVMDYATLTDNHGRKTDFSHAILIMTSNAGAARARTVMGFGDTGVASSDVMDEVKATFSPEFRNRLSKIVMFHALNEEMGMLIVEKNLKQMAARLQRKQIAISFTEPLKAKLLKEGFSLEYGARELERMISSSLNPLLVDYMLRNQVHEGEELLADLDETGAYAIVKK